MDYLRTDHGYKRRPPDATGGFLLADGSHASRVMEFGTVLTGDRVRGDGIGQREVGPKISTATELRRADHLAEIIEYAKRRVRGY